VTLDKDVRVEEGRLDIYIWYRIRIQTRIEEG
jgi:hypothetical protein